MKRIILTALLSLSILLIYAEEFIIYVSPEGNDQWSGKMDKPSGDDGPMLTVSSAVGRIRDMSKKPGQADVFRIILREGVYQVHETILITDEDDFELWIEAYPGEKPIISAGKKITGWKNGKVNGVSCWVVNLPEVKAGEWYFRQLFVNGKRVHRPRLPETGFFEVEDPLLGKSANLGEQLNEAARDHFIYREGDIKEWKNLADVNVMVVHYWQEDYLPIKEIHPEKREVVFSAKSYMAFVRSHPFHACGNAWYYVDNVFEALDSPGEWYLERKTGNLYYIPEKGEKIQNAAIYAPISLQVLRIEGDPEEGKYAENIHIRGITFKHNAVRWDAHYGTGNNFGNSGPAMLSYCTARNCSIEDCIFTNLGEYAVEIYGGSSNIYIIGNEFSDMAAGAIKISSVSKDRRGYLPVEKMTNAIVFTDNEVHSGGRIFHGAVAVLANYIRSSRFLHNHISDFYYNALVCGGSGSNPGCYDNLIMKNHIHDIGLGWLSDMGGIYVPGLQPGMIISENKIHDITSACYGGNAVYLDDRAQHIIVERNLLYGTNTNIINMKGSENIIRNNILAFGDESLIRRASANKNDTSVAMVLRNVMLVNGGNVHRTRNEIPLKTPGYYSNLNMIWDIGGKPLTVEQPFSYKRTPDVWTFDKWIEITGNDTYSMIADPKLADPLNGDFTPLPGSGIKAFGIDIGDFSDVGPRPEDKRENPFRKPVLAPGKEGHVE